MSATKKLQASKSVRNLNELAYYRFQWPAGQSIHRALFDQKNICFVDRIRMRPYAIRQLSNCLQREKPKVIVNCAAYTAVDAAEDDEQTAMRVNALAVGEMARWSADNGALMVHFSTDYVFDGSSEDAYRESDTVNPLTAYGRSKAAGEELLFNAGGAALCLRTSWVHSNEGHNFLRTMRRLISEQNKLGVVNDQFGVPTTTDFLVKMTRQLIANFSKSKSECRNSFMLFQLAYQLVWFCETYP